MDGFFENTEVSLNYRMHRIVQNIESSLQNLDVMYHLAEQKIVVGNLNFEFIYIKKNIGK